MQKTKMLVACVVFWPAVVLGAVSGGADVNAPGTVTLNLTADLVAFLKFTVWAGSIFLAVFAGLCVTFFGIDIKNARKEIRDSEKEMREAVANAQAIDLEIRQRRMDFEEFVRDAKKKLELIGSEIEAAVTPSEKETTSNVSSPKTVTSAGPRDMVGDTNAPMAAKPETLRAPSDLIRELLLSSQFPWSTMTRLKRGTGLSETEILTITRSMPDVRIGYNEKTQEQLFRLSRL